MSNKSLEPSADESPALEDTLSCLDVLKGIHLYRYYDNDLKEEDAREFEEHLIHCSFCRRKLLRQRWINETLRAELRKSAHLKSSTSNETKGKKNKPDAMSATQK